MARVQSETGQRTPAKRPSWILPTNQFACAEGLTPSHNAVTEDKDQTQEESHECFQNNVVVTLKDTALSYEGAGCTATGGSFQRKALGGAGLGVLQLCVMERVIRSSHQTG